MGRTMADASAFGVVAIGRNEGERLQRCLDSALRLARWVVYVDSASTDGSTKMARARGVSVVELDMSVPFTAARARNEGFRRLSELAPGLTYVQFVDGDCELADAWLDTAFSFLEKNPGVAAVCGRRRERFPERSVFNLLCDIEWDTPVGETKACGGDVMMRCDALREAGGYRGSLIAGEEPELCVRLRTVGWRIWRLDAEMTLHDANMMRLGQWWKRNLRAGHAFAEGAYLHGAPPERHWVRESRSSLAWGVGGVMMLLFGCLIFGAWGLAVSAIFPLQILRLSLRGKRTPRENWWQATFLLIGKFPEAAGQLKFHWNRLFGRKSRLIEYK